MRFTKKIKTHAKSALRGNFGNAVVIMLLTVSVWILFYLCETIAYAMLGIEPFINAPGAQTHLVLFTPNISPLSIAITFTAVVFAFMVTTPLALGQKAWYLGICSRPDEKTTRIFDFFSSRRLFIKALGIRLTVAARLFGYGLLFYAMPVFLAALSIRIFAHIESYGALAATVCLMSCVMLFATMTPLFVIFSQRYYLVDYLALDPNIKFSKAVKMSVAYMAGHKVDTFMLAMSFIAWYPVCLLVLPSLYVLPYYNASKAILAKFIIDLNKELPTEYVAQLGSHESVAMRAGGVYDRQTVEFGIISQGDHI